MPRSRLDHYLKSSPSLIASQIVLRLAHRSIDHTITPGGVTRHRPRRRTSDGWARAELSCHGSGQSVAWGPNKWGPTNRERHFELPGERYLANYGRQIRGKDAIFRIIELCLKPKRHCFFDSHLQLQRKCIAAHSPAVLKRHSFVLTLVEKIRNLEG